MLAVRVTEREKPFSIEENINFNGSLKQVTAKAVKIIEKTKIEHVLKLVEYNKTKAAKLLEISYKTLLDKIKEYEISKEN